MAGWLLQSAALVRIAPSFPPMAFATAFSFALAGIALAWPAASAKRGAVARACGAALAAVALAALLERAFGAALGAELPALRRWLDGLYSFLGLMSVPTALGFLAGGGALAASAARRAALARALTLVVGAIGALSIAGYLVNAGLLFPGYFFSGVALHTAVGLAVFAAGLHAAIRAAASRAPLFARADDRIAFVAAAVLVSMTLCAGLAAFAVLQGRVEKVVSDDLRASLARRVDFFRELIELREGSARIAATRPAAARNLRVIHAGRDDGSNLANVQAVVDGFLREGFGGVAYRDLDGRIVAKAGRFADAPALVAPLTTQSGGELLWNDGGFILRHRLPVRDPRGEVGQVEVEQPLPTLTRLAYTAPGEGDTWDMGLCARRDARLLCFPQRLNPAVFTTGLVNSAGERLPMTRALDGENGIVVTRDYRHQNVLAAYAPVDPLGLGMVVKVDAAEIFAPIREQLQLAAALLLALAAAGTVVLRAQVSPLARRLVDAEIELKEINAALDARVRERTAQLETALEELGRSEAHYRMLFDSNPHPMWVYDAQTLRYLAVNDAAIRHYGYTREEFLGMTPLEVRPPEDREAVREVMAGLDEGRMHRGTFRHLKKDGERIFVEISSQALRFLGRPARLVLADDITARKQAEDGIRKLNEELEERVKQRTAALEATNSELEAFSYSVSHDLRAPLRHIGGFANLLDEDSGPRLGESGQRFLKVIRDAATQMGRLIDDLLLFSRMGRVDMRRESVDMGALAREAVAEVERGAPQQPFEWRIGELPRADGDRALLKQVWLNLLSNAAKYSRNREPSVITVEGSVQDGEASYCVRDNGAGFDMKYAAKLFGVFQRLHRPEEFEGTGIGLANVRRIVVRHGGRTWAESEPDRGASFYFTLSSRENAP
jgi:hypothetical protein